MPAESFEAFRGPPQELLAAALALSGNLAHDGELSVKVSHRQGVRKVTFEFTHGAWDFKGFVRAKSGEIVLEDVHWGGAQ